MSAEKLRFTPSKDFDRNSLQNTVLVFPAANSIGQVGQLAVDLLISTFSLPRVGFLESPFLLPISGQNAYGTTGISTTFEGKVNLSFLFCIHFYQLSPVLLNSFRFY